MKKRIFWLLLIAAGVAAVWAVPVLAQKATPSDDEVNAIARQLYCPVCENIPLDVCPTQACTQWRALIREKLAQGWTEAQIKQYFVDQYGARVLSEPPRLISVLPALIVLYLPALFILGGVILLIWLFRSWKRPAPAAAEQPPASAAVEPTEAADDYLKRFEDEAGKLK